MQLGASSPLRTSATAVLEDDAAADDDDAAMPSTVRLEPTPRFAAPAASFDEARIAISSNNFLDSGDKKEGAVVAVVVLDDLPTPVLDCRCRADCAWQMRM